MVVVFLLNLILPLLSFVFLILIFLQLKKITGMSFSGVPKIVLVSAIVIYFIFSFPLLLISGFLYLLLAATFFGLVSNFFVALGLFCIYVGLGQKLRGEFIPSFLGLPRWKWLLIFGLVSSFFLAPFSVWVIYQAGYRPPPPSICYMVIPNEKYALDKQKMNVLVRKFEAKGVLSRDAVKKILGSK